MPRIVNGCHRCALPGNWGNVGLCADCIRKPPEWDQAIAALSYAYPVEHIARRFKFHRDMPCGQLLANELIRSVSNHMKQNSDRWNKQPAELMVPVPLHFTRQFQRGFNQSELLAQSLQRSLRIPLGRKNLRRVRSTSAQSGLNRKNRQKNLSRAFQARSVSGQHVLLVDDVMTTGTTLRECSATLRKAGASFITVCVAARVPAP